MTEHLITPYEIALRYTRRFAKLGLHPKCSICGYAGIWALSVKNKTICYECICSRQGKSLAENHHILGKKNGRITVPLPGNFHRLLYLFQEWDCYDCLIFTTAGHCIYLLFLIYDCMLRWDMRVAGDLT